MNFCIMVHQPNNYYKQTFNFFFVRKHYYGLKISIFKLLILQNNFQIIYYYYNYYFYQAHTHTYICHILTYNKYASYFQLKLSSRLSMGKTMYVSVYKSSLCVCVCMFVLNVFEDLQMFNRNSIL